MRRAALGVLLVLAAAGVAAQDPASAPIAGHVYDARDNAPLRRARIALAASDRTFETALFTDDEGRFVLAGPPASAVTLRITKAGYATLTTTLPAKRSPAEMRIGLARSAAVMGRVVDAGGPVTNAFVTARRIVPDGDRTALLSARFYAQTDRLGEYRLGGLPPGRYEMIGIRIPPEVSYQRATIEDTLFGPAELFDVGAPVVLDLHAGDEAREISFTVPNETERCATGPSVQPPEGAVAGRIEGRVSDAAGQPIACAVVRIASPEAPVPQVYTDRQGFYAFDGLPGGSYFVSATKTGYLTMRHGQRNPEDSDVAVSVKEGQRRQRIDITLVRESIVSGTIVDEHGEPVEGAAVWPYVFSSSRPGVTALIGAPQPTDDRGQYRIIGVAPGTYVVGVINTTAVGGRSSRRGYVPTYHPGTPDVGTATPVTVAPGRDVSGVDIVLAPVATATVSGRVLDVTGRPYVGGVALSARAPRPGAPAVNLRMAAQTDSEGAFAFNAVPRGDYVVRAPGPASGATRLGMQYVSVIEGDPAPITVAITDGATIEGRIVLDAAAGTNPAGLTVSFASADPDYAPAGAFPAPTYARESDGSFRMSGLFGPTRITIPALPACEECFLASARVNGGDAVDTPFDFGLKGGRYQDVEVVVSDAGAAIEGRVTDERGMPASTYTVVALSAHESLRYEGSRYTKAGRRQPDGTFRITGLPPGDYVVGAVRRIDGAVLLVPLQDGDVLARIAAHGQRVTVVERERRTLDLRVLSP